ncbi:MAG: hypothetical protein COB07_04595 [Sulfurovum sp.]|nr:MAG: hypothetical protein COB07_04595 [Sulfurovum sp.]
MKKLNKTLLTATLLTALLVPGALHAEQAKGLNVIVNSDNKQTQAMAMVLSLVAIKKHHKEVHMILCGKAGNLADKNIKGLPVKRPNGTTPSAKDHLKKIIKLGATVQVCPLYLPNSGKDKSILLEGITVAKPPAIAAKLLDTAYKNISF